MSQDVFHCKRAIIRRTMECTRRIVLKHSASLVKNFIEEVLKSMFTDFYIYCWNNGLNFNKFKEHDLSMFVFKMEKVVSFFKTHLTFNDQIKNVLNGSQTLHDIFEFLSLSYIRKGNIFILG